MTNAPGEKHEHITLDHDRLSIERKTIETLPDGTTKVSMSVDRPDIVAAGAFQPGSGAEKLTGDEYLEYLDVVDTILFGAPIRPDSPVHAKLNKVKPKE